MENSYKIKQLSKDKCWKRNLIPAVDRHYLWVTDNLQQIAIYSIRKQFEEININRMGFHNVNRWVFGRVGMVLQQAGRWRTTMIQMQY
jgi:hypothetical protein